MHQELWIPAEVLESFNRQIQGTITVEAAFYGDRFTDPINRATQLPARIVAEFGAP